MKSSNILWLLVLSILFLSNGFAEELTKVEKEKRHIVSRMYQATYGILQICPDREVDSFKKIIKNFEETYFEFSKLLNESQYHQYAVDNMIKDIAQERKKSDRSRISQCSFGKSMTLSLISTTGGQKSVSDMLVKLKKNDNDSNKYISSSTQNHCKLEGIDFSDNMVVYAGGAYSGKKINYQIDQSGHQATQFDVIVNSPNEPVALILGAYEPSIWNITWTEGTYIEAVVVTGYHRQAVAGLSNDIPILNSSYDNKGPCQYMYVANKNIKKINPLSNKVYEKNVKMVYYAENGNIVFGKQVNEHTKLLSSKDNPPNSFVNKSNPLAGEAGLEDLVSKGMLRHSNSSDINRWAQQKEEAYKKILKAKNEELPPVANAKKRTAFKL